MKKCYGEINRYTVLIIIVRLHFFNTLLCLIVGGSQTANFGKHTAQAHLINIREWPKNNPPLPILTNLNNSAPPPPWCILFYPAPPHTVSHKREVTKVLRYKGWATNQLTYVIHHNGTNNMTSFTPYYMCNFQIFDKIHSFLKNVWNVPDSKKGKLYLWRTT